MNNRRDYSYYRESEGVSTKNGSDLRQDAVAERGEHADCRTNARPLK